MRFWRKSKAATPTGGEQARKQAEENLTQTMAETPMFAALGASLRELREENHFAARIRESMRPR